MDSFFAIAVLLGAVFVAFRQGKHIGSRLGFGIGRRIHVRRRSTRRHR